MVKNKLKENEDSMFCKFLILPLVVSLLVIAGCKPGGKESVNSLEKSTDACAFPVKIFNCLSAKVNPDSISLTLRNDAEVGRDMTIKKIAASSEALGTGNLGIGCSTGLINVFLGTNATATFNLNNGDSIRACNFKDTGESQNFYNITVFYSWVYNPEVIHTMPGEIYAIRH